MGLVTGYWLLVAGLIKIDYTLGLLLNDLDGFALLS